MSNYCKNCYELTEKLEAKEQECEQLKRKEQECEKLKFTLKHTGLLDLINENVKLKQALDEIEKYLDAQQKYFDGEDYHNLLDIINKAKEK